MNALSSIPSVVAAAVLSLLLSGRAPRTNDAPPAGPIAHQATEDPNIRCAARRATSDSIPFEPVDLGPAAKEQGGNDLLLGPRMLVVVSDSTRWPAVWRAAVGDSIPVPPVAFGKAVLVLVATRTEGMGRIRLKITSIRECRRTGVVVVSTMQSELSVGIAVMTRGITAVRVPGRELATNVVLFEDQFRYDP